jgi:MerR family redox-sensitive transcriptional activator SoxR
VPELMTIGEMARRAGVATSAVRYYERRGLLSADARHSGQRRYQAATLRRLVFIGMMQDTGLTLDEVRGVLSAATAAEWKSIAGHRLAALDEQIAQLQHARMLLAAALSCRYDHPATDCTVMGSEIDRRLGSPGAPYHAESLPSTCTTRANRRSACPEIQATRNPFGYRTVLLSPCCIRLRTVRPEWLGNPDFCSVTWEDRSPLSSAMRVAT